MKTTIIIIPFLLTQLCSFGQEVTIKGVMQSRPGVTIRFSYPEDPIKGSINVSEVTTDENGTFSTTFEVDRKRPIRVDFNIPDSNRNPHPYANYLWIEPNKVLQVIIKSDTALFYSGQCVNENNTLKEIGLNGRVDYETKDSINEDIARRIGTRINEFSENHSGAIIEDYGKGLFSESLCQKIITDFKAKGLLVAVDPSRSTPPMWYKGATLLKPNRLESHMMVEALGYFKERKLETIAKILVEKLRGTISTT